jgi:hypothetical protein
MVGSLGRTLIFRSAVPASCLFFVVAAGVVVANRADAQVVEPNGIGVPRAVANGEIALGQYFASRGETIDAVAAASVSPGVFSPLCGFEASLVLSQSGALAGISWYNVPAASDTAPPSAIYPLVPEGTPINVTVASADIRSNPNYQGGLIGFVLTKGGARVYYSEYKRNANCVNCIQPGYWKMALAYPSSVVADTYYLAFEDWEGANATDWGQNDGDFNDKVFRITGVRCPGGGMPCDTGKAGLCGQGLTECQANGVVCKQIVPESVEVCDGVDNDCNGRVDDGDHLCKDGEVCLRGVCVPGCGHGEFSCSSGFVCVDALCVDERCVDVVCDEGRVCRAGQCVGACDGVACPGEQGCRVGRCVDPCAGVTCPASRVCQGGVCIEACSCVGCAAGTTCNLQSGRCGSPGCEIQSCDGGAVCRAGACVDPCGMASCPGGGACTGGACQDPVGAGAADGGTGGGGLVILGGTGGMPSMAGQGGSSATSGSAGGPPAAGTGAGTDMERRQGASSGCGCHLGRPAEGRWGTAAIYALLAVSLRRPLHRRRRVAR